MYEFLSYRVADVMTTRPIIVGPDMPLAEAQRILTEHDFNGLPVVRNGDQLIGVLTKLDVLKAFAFSPQSVIPHYEEIMRQPVERFMTGMPDTVDPQMPLTRLLQRMIDTRYKSFPVVRDGRLVGIVAREDVVTALQRAVANGNKTG